MERNRRKERVGKVLSTKCDKTAVVLVERTTQHPIYKKYIKTGKKYMIHDENNECIVGQKVRFMETRPLSKKKRWRLVEIYS